MADECPYLPGGDAAFNRFIAHNLKWPDKSGMIDVQGSVFISFIIEKNGRLTSFKIIHGFNPEFDHEALRVIKLSPRWLPAKVNGKPVRISYIVPVKFTLNAH
jgi:protein TonB